MLSPEVIDLTVFWSQHVGVDSLLNECVSLQMRGEIHRSQCEATFHNLSLLLLLSTYHENNHINFALVSDDLLKDVENVVVLLSV